MRRVLSEMRYVLRRSCTIGPRGHADLFSRQSSNDNPKQLPASAHWFRSKDCPRNVRLGSNISNNDLSRPSLVDSAKLSEGIQVMRSAIAEIPRKRESIAGSFYTVTKRRDDRGLRSFSGFLGRLCATTGPL